MNLKHQNCKYFEVGVNPFMSQNRIYKQIPTSLNQETRGASNVCPNILLRLSSRKYPHINCRVCDTAYLAFIVGNLSSVT